MREALALHKKLSGVRDVTTAQTMNDLAAVLYQSGRFKESLAQYREALPIYRELYGNEHPEIGVLLNGMGGAALMAGSIDEAEPLLRQALAMEEKLQGPTHDDLIAPLNRLAMIETFQGRIPDAERDIQRAENIARLPDHGLLLDQVLVNRAALDCIGGRLERAEAALAESRTLLESAFPLGTRPGEAWRYAYWDTVNAEVMAARGNPTAPAVIASAYDVLERRYGAAGFYPRFAQLRQEFVKQQLSLAAKKPQATAAR
jgi:tetratricopeptide (TPR) repeat protein